MKNLLNSLSNALGFVYVHISSSISAALILSVIIVGEGVLYTHVIGAVLFLAILSHFALSLILLSKYKFYNRAWCNGSLITAVIVMVTVLISILGTSPMQLGVIQLSLIGMILLFMIINFIQK